MPTSAQDSTFHVTLSCPFWPIKLKHYPRLKNLMKIMESTEYLVCWPRINPKSITIWKICMLITSPWHMPPKYRVIEEERSIFCGIIVLVIVRRKLNLNMCVILNGYWDRAIWISRPNSIRFLFVGLDETWSLQKKDGYTETNCLLKFWMVLPTWSMKINSDKQHMIIGGAKQTEVDGF